MSENDTCVVQDVQVAGSSNPQSPRIQNSIIKNLRSSLKDKITSEIKNLLAESQKEMLSLLKSRANANPREEPENEPENETRSFSTPTKPIRINSTQNNDPCNSRNMVTGVLNDSTNQPKKAKIRFQSQPASKKRPAAARTLFATDKNDGTTLPMPKALTASLPTFDRKSEVFEIFEDLFPTISKCTRISVRSKN